MSHFRQTAKPFSALRQELFRTAAPHRRTQMRVAATRALTTQAGQFRPFLFSSSFTANYFSNKKSLRTQFRNGFWRRRQAVETEGAGGRCSPKGIPQGGQALYFTILPGAWALPLQCYGLKRFIKKGRPGEKHRVETRPVAGFKVTSRIQVLIGRHRINVKLRKAGPTCSSVHDSWVSRCPEGGERSTEELAWPHGSLRPAAGTVGFHLVTHLPCAVQEAQPKLIFEQVLSRWAPPRPDP